MDDEVGPTRHRRLLPLLASLAFLAGFVLAERMPADTGPGNTAIDALGMPGPEATALTPWDSFQAHFPPARITWGITLLALSAFFSGSETACFSIRKLRLRAIAEETTLTSRLITRLMANPGRLLTTILVGNVIVNVLIGATLGSHAEEFCRTIMPFSATAAYVVAVAVVTSILVFFGEILPKVAAVGASEVIARTVAIPLLLTDRLLAPLRTGLLKFTDFLFRITRIHTLRAAPFITDDELRSVLTDGEAQGVLEQEEREMIEGILEFSDALVREILVPRPDVVALPEDLTVEETLARLREHDYSRMPVYRESLDRITGILVAKDLLPDLAAGRLARPINEVMRPPHFVPETMTVRQFVRDAQHRRTHLAIVVDEFGGTAGIVTLQDAIQEVVGTIIDEDEPGESAYERLSDSAFRLSGSLSLDEVSEIVGVPLEDEEHTTIAGLLMSLVDKVPEPGDQAQYAGMQLTVEECEGKRASRVRIDILPPPPPNETTEGAPK